ncbi:hypothetical protein JAAARDRAFT_41582 [Jaapia argillacea MUCL 33604]|uniref:Uncharacterized protein n=1 Tax=Jaapia argillacea MUCL 33604 TaxID=933084 RepID=A0A067PIX8_9AGAM|nr:hypothetical protein JAAARDRAFT_41582 [Jaapia argillacea MUCL 33604]
MEIFEGYLSFRTIHSLLYKVMNEYGRGNSDSFAFWAVRAKTDKDGNEIGLKPFDKAERKAAYTMTFAYDEYAFEEEDAQVDEDDEQNSDDLMDSYMATGWMSGTSYKTYARAKRVFGRW